MTADLRRRLVAAAVMVLAGAGYALAPLATAAPTPPAMRPGHVPLADTPLAGAVVVGPGGAVTGYDTKVVVITQGTPLTFVNLDEIAHTVTAVARDTSGTPLFNGNALPGTTSTVWFQVNVGVVSSVFAPFTGPASPNGAGATESMVKDWVRVVGFPATSNAETPARPSAT